MEINWIEVASDATKKLLSIQAAIENSAEHLDEPDEDLSGHLLWHSPRTNGEWGQMVYLELSCCGNEIRVKGDDCQPWGNGMDNSHVFATVAATNLPLAAQILSRVARSGFALDTLQENETSGKYERGTVELPQMDEQEQAEGTMPDALASLPAVQRQRG
jgi:hypothetical protein